MSVWVFNHHQQFLKPFGKELMGNVLMGGSSWQHLNQCINLNQKNRYSKPPNRMQEEIFNIYYIGSRQVHLWRFFFHVKTYRLYLVKYQVSIPNYQFTYRKYRDRDYVKWHHRDAVSKIQNIESSSKIQFFQKKSLFNK